MTNIICIPYSLVDTYIRDNRLYINNTSYIILKSTKKDTYLEVTYKL